MVDNKELVIRAHNGDKSARDMLLCENTGLIYSIVKRFANRGIEVEDLFQIGCVGMLKAIDKFDTNFNVQFSTYAVPMITGEIKRFLRDDGIIKVSRTVKENNIKISRVIEDVNKKYGREPTIEEIENQTGLSRDDILFALDSRIEVDSIYKTVNKKDGDEMYIVDKLASNGMLGNGNDIEKHQDIEKEKIINHIVLMEVVQKLSDEEREIIKLRFFKEKTQTETAKVMGTNQVQISRMEKRAILKLREYLQL